MAKEQVLSFARAADRLEIIWQLINKDHKWLPFKLTKPDFKEIGQQMTSSGKQADFVLTWDEKKLALVVRVNRKDTAVGSKDVSSETDPKKKYELLKSISDNSTLLPSNKLPADPAVVATQRDKVTELQGQVKRLKELAEKQPTKYDSLDQGQQEMGLGGWAKTKNLDRFPRFLMAVDWGRDAKFIVDEFIKDDASSPISPKLKKATRDAILAAHSSGAAPNFTAARKEILVVVDTTLMPAYVAYVKAGVAKEVARLNGELKTEAGKLQQLVK